MTAFAERQRCRECQTKLPSPTSNDHHAFCCKGCHAAFYRQRCAVCETERVSKRLCYRLKCRSAYRKNRPGFMFPGQGSGSVKERARNADLTGIKSATDSRFFTPWRVVAAGAPISANQYHCATVPDGMDCQWAGGDYERIEAKNTAALVAHAKTRRKSPAVPNCDAAPSHWHPVSPAQPIPDDLSIPAFLVRA